MKKFKLRPLYPAILYFLICLIFVIEALFVEQMNYVFDFVGYGGTFAHHDLKILGLPAYWFLMLCGFLFSLALSLKGRKLYGFRLPEAWLIPVVFLAVSLLGGKLLYIFENWESVRANGIGFDGLSLFGAIFTVPLAAWLASRSKKLPFRNLLDLCALLGLTLLVCVRTGCFINGCCGGIKLWHGTRPVILPVQLVEVILDLLIAEACLYARKKANAPGAMYPVFMLGYGICRFLLEFLRTGKKIFLIFTESQLLALVCIAIGAGMYYFLLCRKKRI